MLLGRLTGGILQDTFGRRIGLAIADIFIIISVSLTWALGPIYYTLLLICRLLLGIGISLALLIGCTYLSEISPPKWRGRMVTSHELSIATAPSSSSSVLELIIFLTSSSFRE
mmetsp:Transcript_2475/g.2039  ORF Transcript_2475/g.2039 Transcript_2475/m.2039 type:complete len:113 (-) Transcript_2475:93-431(-)